MTGRPDIDRALLAADVSAWMARNGLTTRSASAAFAGLNPAMVSRACTLQVLSAASLLTLCCAMQADPLRYLVNVSHQKNQAVTAIGARETVVAQP